MTNVYMKDSLKRITAVILLAAATLLVALQCGSIAKKEEAAALLRADASSSCNKMPPDGFFRESVESPKAAVDDKINAINTVLIGMPVASYGTMFCLKYGRDETDMVRGTLITTILSVVTIPLLTLLF